jgi:phosphoesterase RecJ-like protein
MANIQVTENGFGYLKIDDDVLKEYCADAATAGNMINNFNNIEEIISWAFFSHDKVNNNIRGSIRSRGPVINEIAAQFGGGGHALASGVKLPSFEKADELIQALDEACKKYNEEKQNIEK